MMRSRRGFSLIEVMVAMTLLSIVLMSLAKVSVSVATRGRTNELIAKRNAVLQAEANRFVAMRFDSLGTWNTTTKSFTSGGFAYSRKLTITKTSFSRYSVKIVIVPTANPAKKDSVMFERAKAATGSPLCVGC